MRINHGRGVARIITIVWKEPQLRYRAVDESARKDVVEALLPVVRAAGAAVLRARDANLTMHLKQGLSPVTSTDLESESIIRQGGSRLFPTNPAIGEEGAPLLSTCLEVPSYPRLSPTTRSLAERALALIETQQSPSHRWTRRGVPFLSQ